VGLFHREPVAVGLEPPFEKPFRLFFFGGQRTDDIFVQAGGEGIGINIGRPAVFVLGIGELSGLPVAFFYAASGVFGFHYFLGTH